MVNGVVGGDLVRDLIRSSSRVNWATYEELETTKFV